MFDDYKAENLNAAFVNLIKTAEGAEEVINATENFLRIKIRESAFFRQILPPVIITPAELDRAVDHRSPIKIIDIEPDAPAAVPIDFRGGTETTYVKGDRYQITFYTISSNEFQIREPELLTYRMPITAILRENILKEIEHTEDMRFIQAADVAANNSGNVVTITGATTIQKEHLVQLFKALSDKKLKAAIILMPLPMFDDILAWDYTVLGGELLKEVTINGYTYHTILGKRIIVTNKVDVVPENVAYAFTEQKFLGHAFLLDEDVKFEMKKDYDLIKFKAWEVIGAGIGNANAVAKLVLQP